MISIIIIKYYFLYFKKLRQYLMIENIINIIVLKVEHIERIVAIINYRKLIISFNIIKNK